MNLIQSQLDLVIQETSEKITENLLQDDTGDLASLASTLTAKQLGIETIMLDLEDDLHAQWYYTILSSIHTQILTQVMDKVKVHWGRG